MGVPSINDYLSLLNQLQDTQNCKVGPVLYKEFSRYTKLITDTEQQKKYSEPMPWIGMYITLASIFCILAMAADLIHGLKKRKLWFPCKYFTLDAASLSVIAVAIKLPMDLNNSMGGRVDQATKLGSMAFMCTMMANLLPSLPTVANKELVTNVIALVVLVITLVVNVCIQIKTGVVSIPTDTRVEIFTSLFVKEKQLGKDYRKPPSIIGYIGDVRFIAISYVVMLLALMIIYICSALTIPSCKQTLERNYKRGHEITSRELERKTHGIQDLYTLEKFVSRYWVMAETSSRQLMAVCSLTTTTSGLICALTTILHIFTTLHNLKMIFHPDSDYDWSIPVIFITQFIGVIFGIIAPLSRCFASLSLKVSIWEHIKVFKVEIYWTQKLYDWQQSRIPLRIHSRKCKVVVEKSKFLILSTCIGIQKTVVVVCKLMALISFFFMACVIFGSLCWKRLKVKFSASGTVTVTEHQKQQPQHEFKKEYCKYALYVLLQDEGFIFDRRKVLTSIFNSMNRLIKKAEKQTPKNLMDLLRKSGRFQGIEKLGNYHVPTLLLEEYPNCWSLPLVNLTAIAISLPNIKHKKVGSLVSSVGEGMFYVTLVEEYLNTTDEYVRIQKAAKMLWLQVDVYHKWLGNKLNDPTRKLKTTKHILEWFRHTAIKIRTEKKDKIRTETKDKDNESSTRNSIFKSICATSMYNLTQTILLSYHENIEVLADTSCFPTNKGEMLDQEEVFVQLSSMISDILAVCFTNLPQVILMRCYTSEIEKMEASVYAAAQLLGETTQIINRFEDQEIPSLDLDESMLHPLP